MSEEIGGYCAVEQRIANLASAPGDYLLGPIELPMSILSYIKLAKITLYLEL